MRNAVMVVVRLVALLALLLPIGLATSPAGAQVGAHGSWPEPALLQADTGDGDESGESPPDDPVDDRPNIVIFMTDDQTVEQMAVLDLTNELLTDQGMTFTQSVVNLASCCPSRTTLLTGQHAANHGVITNGGVSGGFYAFEDQDTTMPAALQQAGYDTVFVGKYLNGYGFLRRFTPPGWTDFRGLISPTEVLYHSPAFWIDDVVWNFEADDYATDVIHDNVFDALDRVGNDNPVFAWVSYPAPHAQAGRGLRGLNRAELFAEARNPTDELFLRPPLVAERHQGIFDADSPLIDTPSLDEEDISDKPGFMARLLPEHEPGGPAETFQAAQLGSLLSVDESVAGIVERLRDEERDTWFIFTSDNGLLLGAHRHYGAKYFPYEENIRVPLIIAGPGVEPGSTMPLTASNVDLAPTVLDLAEAESMREVDGISLVPYATGERQAHGRAVLLEGYEFRPSSPPFVGVHTGSSVYIEWFSGDRELYDLTADPYQLENLFDDPDAEPLLTRNQALLAELVGCVGEECHEVGADLPDPVEPTRATPTYERAEPDTDDARTESSDDADSE